MEAVLTARQYARLRKKVQTKKRNEPPRLSPGEEIGRASCRERVCLYV